MVLCSALAATTSRRTLLTLVAVALLLCLALPLTSAQTASSSKSEYYYDGENYYYTLFTNYLPSDTFADGASGVGRYGAPGYGAAFDDTGVVFNDKTRGSRIRKITHSGLLYTITGSRSSTGCIAGAASTATFGSITTSDSVNGLIAASGGYYLADSQCSMLRFVNATSNVTQNILSFLPTTEASRPSALAKTPYAGGTMYSNIYVTDTANNNIRFLTLDTPITAIQGTLPDSSSVFAPVGIALLPSIRRIVVTNNMANFIYLDYTSSGSATSSSWNTLSTYQTNQTLVTSYDGLHVEYVSSNTILRMPVSTPEATAGTAVPTTVLTFTPLPASASNGVAETMLLFGPRSANSYYVLTTHRYLIVSATPISPSPSSSSSSSSETPTPTPTPHSSSSSSSSSRSGTPTPTPTPTPTSTDTPTPTPTDTPTPTPTDTPTPTPTDTPTPTPTPKEASCDGVCKGAIASSVVMACAGITLIVLMIVAPANIFTAIVMVPII